MSGETRNLKKRLAWAVVVQLVALPAFLLTWVFIHKTGGSPILVFAAFGEALVIIGMTVRVYDALGEVRKRLSES